MPRWQDTEASLVEGFIWFEINALAIYRRYLVQSIYHTTLFELSVCRTIFLSKYNFHNNCNNLFYIIGSLTIPTWKQLNLKVL